MKIDRRTLNQNRAAALRRAIEPLLKGSVGEPAPCVPNCPLDRAQELLSALPQYPPGAFQRPRKLPHRKWHRAARALSDQIESI